ncbi:hypothetical protein B124-14_050 [Bacteroides phage B124-14]|uniref:hypothetical protein n=1 Tax=Bacteroides phage B124-14 TaxID=1105171 RepID=UPI0002459C80|nr:hypothetical protein B124-14_050 [Bacteroides phage B124-14]CCE45979.1 hypothetical protein B124-14_050 [Bacteroides phage B124-14]
MATMTTKQFCERLYGMYHLLGGSESRCAQYSRDRFSCGYGKENTFLTNALMKACDNHKVPYKIEEYEYFIIFVVKFK